MQLSRFWWSVWSVAKYLLGLSLLISVIVSVATLFGFMPRAILPWVIVPAGAFATIAGTFLYADWQWGWTFEHMGLHRRPGAITVGLAGGALLGGLAALTAHLVEGWSTGSGFALPAAAVPLTLDVVYPLVMVLLTSFSIELVFRAAAISRYQADLSQREILLASTLTPLGWMLIQALLQFGSLSTGINGSWELLMSVALALLFIRFDSAWLTTGIRVGMSGTVLLLWGSQAALTQGGTIVWGIAAVVLLALEWFKQQGQPKRMQPTRSRVVRGRTVRGPWGPH